MNPRTAMLLAAGLGQAHAPAHRSHRQAAAAAGRPALIDHALDRLPRRAWRRVVVNAHWHADQVAAHLARPRRARAPFFAREAALLDTGGGVKAALDLLGPEPFFVVNGDAFWLDGPRPALRALGRRVRSGARSMACCWCIAPSRCTPMSASATSRSTPGARRAGRREREVVPYIYAGVQIIAPALLAGTPEGAFSMNQAWDARDGRGPAARGGA